MIKQNWLVKPTTILAKTWQRNDSILLKVFHFKI